MARRTIKYRSLWERLHECGSEAVPLVREFLSQQTASVPKVFDRPGVVFQWAREKGLTEASREEVWLLLLNVRHAGIGEPYCVSVGSLAASIIHPREVFRRAIHHGAAAVVLVHNHPSGDPTPSVEDHEVTRRIREGGLLLGIPLQDHVVVGREGYRSFREEGWLAD